LLLWARVQEGSRGREQQEGRSAGVDTWRDDSGAPARNFHIETRWHCRLPSCGLETVFYLSIYLYLSNYLYLPIYYLFIST
jgi:hypothetical protein